MMQCMYVCHNQKRRMVCVSVKNYLPIFAFIASRQFLTFAGVAVTPSCCVVLCCVFFFLIKLDGDQKAALTHLETTRLIYLCAAFPKWLPSKNSPCYEIVL